MRRPDIGAARQLKQERRLQEWIRQERELLEWERANLAREREALECQREELAREIKKVGQLRRQREGVAQSRRQQKQEAQPPQRRAATVASLIAAGGIPFVRRAYIYALIVNLLAIRPGATLAVMKGRVAVTVRRNGIVGHRLFPILMESELA